MYSILQLLKISATKSLVGMFVGVIGCMLVSNVDASETRPTMPMFTTTLEIGQNYFCDVSPVAFNLYKLLQSNEAQQREWLHQYCRIPVKIDEQHTTLQISNVESEVISHPTETSFYYTMHSTNIFQFPWGAQLQFVDINGRLAPVRIVNLDFITLNKARQKLVNLALTFPNSFQARRMLLFSNLTEMADFDEQQLESFSRVVPEAEIYSARTKMRLGMRGQLQPLTHEFKYLQPSQIAEKLLASIEIEPIESHSHAMKLRDLWFDECILSPVLALTADTLSPVSAAWLSFVGSGQNGYFIAYDDKTATHGTNTESQIYNGWMNAKKVMAYAEKGYSWTRTTETEKTPSRVLAKLLPHERNYILQHENDTLTVPFTEFFKYAQQQYQKHYPERHFYSRTFRNTNAIQARQALIGAALLDVELLQTFSQSCTKQRCSATIAHEIFNTRAFSRTTTEAFINASIPWFNGELLLDIPLPEETLIAHVSSCSSSGIAQSALQIMDMLFNNAPEMSSFSCGFGEDTSIASHLWCWSADGSTILENNKIVQAEYGAYRSHTLHFQTLDSSQFRLTQFLTCTKHEDHVSCVMETTPKQLDPPNIQYTKPEYTNALQLYFNPGMKRFK